ncbi:MAG: GAF domain-containing protein [Deltaproteobacteria bacterium]|nr:GAF domain-containing protein [Deltaproteobacteria bacterium]
MAAEKKKTIRPARLKEGENLLACKKKLGIMDIELEIYRELGGLAVKGASRSTILNRLMDFTLKAIETRSGTLYLIDESTKELSFEVVKGPLAKKLKGLRMRAEAGIAGHVAKTGKPYISSNIAKDRYWIGIKTSHEHSNMMAVPLFRKKKVIGVIEVINKVDSKPFSTSDLKILKSLANHFSIIMERADLFAELDGRVKQFSTLQDVGSLLNSTLDESVVRHRAMEAITQIMQAETGSLLLVDEARGQLYFEVALGEKGKELKEVRLNIGEGIAGWVAKYGKPLVIHDVTKDYRFQGNVDKKSKFITRDMVCVPVKVKGRIIGVLQAINRIGGTFTKEDMKLFQLFSNQVAIALDNARLYEEIRETFHATSEALAEAIEKRDPYTGGHTKRVFEYCLSIAKYLDLPLKSLEVLKLSAVLHDIGKIGIEDSILRKNAPLDADEARSMRMHPQFGAEILKHVPQLKDIIPGMLYHHERIDGKGYPNGFKEEQIPLIARIIAVADTYDAMTTTRPYRKGLPPEAAISELKKCAGLQFDKTVVEAFIKAFHNGDVEGVSKHYSSEKLAEPLPSHEEL